MLEAKRDRETETTPRTKSKGPPAVLDELLGELDELLKLLANKSLLYSESSDDPIDTEVVMLAARLLVDHWRAAPAISMPEERDARVAHTWRRAMIESQERAHQALAVPGEEGRSPEVALSALAEEIATFQSHMP